MGNKKRFSLFELASFFIDSFIGGIKNHVKMLIGLCGFLSALGAVFAATEYGRSFFKKPAPVAIEEPIEYPAPNHDNPMPARNPASLKAQNAQSFKASPQRAVQNSANSNGGAAPEFVPNAIPQASADAPVVAGSSAGFGTSTGGSSGASFSGNSGSSGNSGFAPGGLAGASGAPTKSNNDTITVGGGAALPAATPNNQNTGFANDGSAAAGGSGITVSAPSAGAFVNSGGGWGTGNGLSVRASVGDVVSTNYVANSQFILISGVTGVLRRD